MSRHLAAIEQPFGVAILVRALSARSVDELRRLLAQTSHSLGVIGGRFGFRRRASGSLREVAISVAGCVLLLLLLFLLRLLFVVELVSLARLVYLVVRRAASPVAPAAAAEPAAVVAAVVAATSASTRSGAAALPAASWSTGSRGLRHRVGCRDLDGAETRRPRWCARPPRTCLEGSLRDP